MSKKKKIEKKEEVEELKDEHEIKSIKKVLKFWDRKKLAKTPEECYIITMMFNNGTQKHFVLRLKGHYFQYKKKDYAIIKDESWFDLSLNQYHFYYNEGHATPINREVLQLPEERIVNGRKVVDQSYFSVTPHSLRPIVSMEYVRALSNSVELSKYLKMNALLSFVSVVTSGICCGMIYWGLFK